MILRKIYKFLSSVKLAMALLVVILACCLVGVTIYRGVEAGAKIFGTLWFNGLLVLLVVNVAFSFFGRMWGRKMTLISFGMMLFHLSFVFMLLGVVYNSFFYFRGDIRLTEGETVPSGELQSYDAADMGRFFSVSKLKGETSLIKMYADYKVKNANKRVAYEIAVGETGRKKQGIIYTTESLNHNGFSYFNDKEGYSVLVLLYDKQGRELYGAHLPLQSLKRKDDSYLYTTGTKEGPADMPFPQEPLKPLFGLQVAYQPSKIKERGGEAFFQIWPLDRSGHEKAEKSLAEGKAAVGEKFEAGAYDISVKEIRYWVGMKVSYEPGQPIVLASMWAGLAGIIITFIGRMRKKNQPSAVSNQ